MFQDSELFLELSGASTKAWFCHCDDTLVKPGTQNYNFGAKVDYEVDTVTE